MTTLFLFLFLLPSNSYAKSYTIDEVQIKGWVLPNGDIGFNEIFTYTLNGEFTKLTRSFPAKHSNQIMEFEAYLLDTENPIVGEITNEMLTQKKVTTDGTTRTTEIDVKNKTVSVFYTYIMRGAVKSHPTYSDLDLTFFEKGSSHSIDFNNVTISYVLPDEVGDMHIHGFMYDQNGKIHSTYTNGILFETPVSKMRTLTATRILFPSYIMTEQKKGQASVSLEEAISEEEKRFEAFQRKVALVPTVKTSIIMTTTLFIIIAFLILFLRKRPIALFGNANHILHTDLIYLHYLDQNGSYHPKSILAGLFSMVEKGQSEVLREPSAERFHNHDGAPKETLAFHSKRAVSLLPYEKMLVNLLFKSGLSNQKFHLHEIAGTADGESGREKMYSKKLAENLKEHQNWHEEVKKLLVEAGTLSNRLPIVLKGSIIAIVATLTSLALYVEGGLGSEMVFAIVGAMIAIVFVVRMPQEKRPMLLFFLLMFMISRQLGNGSMKNALLFLDLSAIMIYTAIPLSLLASWQALRTKMNIIQFQSQMKQGPPSTLSEEERGRWLTRAYVLNRNKTKLPKYKLDIMPETAVLATFFAQGTDPFHFVQSTWDPEVMARAMTKKARVFSSSDTSGGIGGDSGGGASGGGGGGAGAG